MASEEDFSKYSQQTQNKNYALFGENMSSRFKNRCWKVLWIFKIKSLKTVIEKNSGLFKRLYFAFARRSFSCSLKIFFCNIFQLLKSSHNLEFTLLSTWSSTSAAKKLKKFFSNNKQIVIFYSFSILRAWIPANHSLHPWKSTFTEGFHVQQCFWCNLVCCFCIVQCDNIKQVQYFHSSPISLNSWRISFCVCDRLSGASLLLLTLNLLTLSRCWENLCIVWSEIRLMCILVPFGLYCAFKS